MKKTLLFATLLVLVFSTTHAQLPGYQSAKSMTSIYNPGHTTHFLLFKPADSLSPTKHPLIIFLHGDGQRGTGSNPEIIASNTGSIPNLCANNASMKFGLNGDSSSFYVLSPQCPGSDGFHPHYIKDMWQWAVDNLNVDTTRVYLTGLSYGGGGVWGFMLEDLLWVKRIAAIAPMSAITGGGKVEVKAAAVASNMPIWAFHATDDHTVSVGSTNYYGSEFGYLDPLWRFTYYTSGDHAGGWIKGSNTSHPTYTVDSTSNFYTGYNGPSSTNFIQNPNVYEWFLSKSRVAANAPVVNAGPDQSIFPSTTTLTGSASIASPATISSQTWSVVSGPLNSSFGAPGSLTTGVSGLVPGTYVFRLTATGSNSTTASDDIQVIVNSPDPAVNAGSDQVIYTTSATLSGTASIASPATISSQAWTVVSGPSGSSFSASGSLTTNANGLAPGVYVFRLTATASTSGSASDDVQVTVISPDPIANAGSDQTITLPTNTATLSGSGTGVNGATIQTYAWLKLSGPSGGALSNDAVAGPTVSSLVQGVYTYVLTVTDNNGRTDNDSVVITVNAAPGGCKVVWTSTPGSLVPCDTLKIKSGTYNYLYIANSRFDGDVYVLPSDSGVLFTGGWTISNVKNIVFRDFKFKDIGGRALSIQNNTDSCVFERFNMHNIGDYCINIDGSAAAYDGTAATRFDDLQFIDDSISKAGPANVFTHINAVTKNLVIRRAVIDSTTGSGSCIAFTDKSINVLIEDSKFTNINIGGTQHNSVMFIKGSGTIRRNYGFSIYGDFIRARPLTFDSTAGHSTPDSLWIYNNRMVSSDKYAFAEMQQGLGDTTTNTSLPNTRTGVGIFLNNTAGNLRSRDYWGGVNNGGGGAMFDVYDWVRTPIFKNNLGFRTYLDSVPDPANPPSQYNFDYMFHNGGGVKPAGQPVFGDTSNNLYRHIAAQLGINDTLTMKIADSSIARHAGTNIYSYKFNTDFEGETRGSSWDIGADQNNNSVVQPPQPPYYGMDSVFIGGRNCLVKRPTEDPAYTSTKFYPLILEIGDQDENLANNPSGLAGLFKSGTPKLVVANANIYPNDMNGHPIYYIMAKIQPLNYGDVAFPNEITPFVTGILAAYPIDTSKYANGMYRHIMLAGQERGADAWFNCTNWALSNGFGSNEPTWVYKIRKIVTSRVNSINNGNTTSTAIWQTFNGRTLRYFEPADGNVVPDSTKARIAQFSNAYQQLYRMSLSHAAVYDSMYSIYGPDTLTNIYRLLIDDSSSSGGDYISGINQSADELMTAEKQTGLLVSPNPVRSILFVSNDKEIRQAAIYSLNGQRLLAKTGTGAILQMNMAGLPKGIYVLQVIDKNGSVQTRRVLKE
jgi:poly(3-hydroxybutyrate) depolymerase